MLLHPLDNISTQTNSQYGNHYAVLLPKSSLKPRTNVAKTWKVPIDLVFNAWNRWVIRKLIEASVKYIYYLNTQYPSIYMRCFTTCLKDSESASEYFIPLCRLTVVFLSEGMCFIIITCAHIRPKYSSDKAFDIVQRYF
jgi:hypothetical protein